MTERKYIVSSGTQASYCYWKGVCSHKNLHQCLGITETIWLT